MDLVVGFWRVGEVLQLGQVEAVLVVLVLRAQQKLNQPWRLAVRIGLLSLAVSYHNLPLAGPLDYAVLALVPAAHHRGVLACPQQLGLRTQLLHLLGQTDRHRLQGKG